MKTNLLLIACALLLSATVSAQNENEETKVKSESKSSVAFDGSSYNFIFSWKKKPVKSHWTGWGFAFSNLNGLENADLNYEKSYSVILNLADYVVPLDSHWLFASGLGFDWSRYHFKGNTGLQDKDGIAQFVKDEQNRGYKSNKLLVYYATIPFVFEYQVKTGSNKLFFIHGGVEGMIKCYSKSQLDVRTDKGNEKIEYHDLNILPLNVRMILRAGFDDFSIFGYYQPYSMFADGKGPDVNPCGVGLMLNF
jgi:hypothetical protein